MESIKVCSIFSPIKMPKFLLENLVHFIAKLHSKITDLLFKSLVDSVLSVAYANLHSELLDSAHEYEFNVRQVVTDKNN